MSLSSLMVSHPLSFLKIISEFLFYIETKLLKPDDTI